LVQDFKQRAIRTELHDQVHTAIGPTPVLPHIDRVRIHSICAHYVLQISHLAESSDLVLEALTHPLQLRTGKLVCFDNLDSALPT
jgi:hypothetical protein